MVTDHLNRIAMLLCSTAAAAMAAVPAQAQTPPVDYSTPPAADVTVPRQEEETGDIVVTARLRSERLMDSPVAVSALSQEDITRYNATDLTRIGSLTPTVIISGSRATGGGSIAIRGLSSPPTNAGFEQPVSVAIDGVQTSSGRIATIAFFDLQQVEILKGPQTLFFGKNSPAGVILLTSAGPSRTLTYGGRVSYEFVADEYFGEAYIAGPLTDTLGARFAVKYRNSEGWLYNNAMRAPNPFFPTSLPAADGFLPGAQSRRIGDDEVMGRLTLEYAPTTNVNVLAKFFAIRQNDQGGGAYAQSIGPCIDGNSRSFGIVDPNSDCVLDNRTSSSDITPAIARSMLRADNDGRSRGRTTAYIGSLRAAVELGKVNLTATTGGISQSYFSYSGYTQTRDNALTLLEDTSYELLSQEIRAASNFESPFNFLVGAFYQYTRDDVYNDTSIFQSLSYNPANGRFSSYEKQADLVGHTYSVFGELLYKPTPTLEISGGLRWTREKKTANLRNTYGVNGPLGQFNTVNTVFATSIDKSPGLLAGRFEGDNFSPAATITWRPSRDLTLYGSYKTGYISGGFGLSGPMQTNSTIGDFDFEPETVAGFEGGIKGQFFDRRLRLTVSAFAYNFRKLQVTVYDPALLRSTIDNAGLLKQRGVEIEGDFRLGSDIRLRGALAYVPNRFEDYTGQCYGYNIPIAQALTAAPPPRCSFRLNADGSRFRTPTGAVVLQQVLDGSAPPRSPDWSGNVGFDIVKPIGTDLELTVTGDAFYSSSYYASDAYSPASLQDPLVRFNSSIAVGSRDNRWRVSLIGNNLFNKYYLLFAGDRTGGASVPLALGEQRGVAARGREVALQAAFNF